MCCNAGHSAVPFETFLSLLLEGCYHAAAPRGLFTVALFIGSPPCDNCYSCCYAMAAWVNAAYPTVTYHWVHLCNCCSTYLCSMINTACVIFYAPFATLPYWNVLILLSTVNKQNALFITTTILSDNN